MAALSVTFGKELSQPLIDIYWDAMRGMAIEQFQESAKHCIKFNKHFPKPIELLEAIQEAPAKKPNPPDLPPRDRKWLAMVNSMFLQYLMSRRLEENFEGDINLAARRAECLSLVAFFEGIEAEGDEEATVAQMQSRFDRAMARVADLSTDMDWLPVELERQELEDKAKEQQKKARAA